MVSEIRIQNLRSLRDTDFIKLKPINILVGTNSSGKSTFLRSFLLLSQSATKRLRGPLAWFDDSLVDFGDFETSKRKNATADEAIVFSFKMENLRINRMPLINGDNYYYLPLKGTIPNLEFSIHYGNDSKEGTYIKKIGAKFGTVEVELEQENREQLKMRVDGRETESILYGWSQGVESGLLPMLMFMSESGIRSISPFHSPSVDKILDVLKNVCDRRLSNINRLYPIISMWDVDKKKFLDKIKSFDNIKSLKNTIAAWTVETPTFLQLYDGLMGLYMYEIWSSINSDLGNYFGNCDYAAPLRAEATRYYRNQGLQVSRVDAYGRNLSEYIDSLPSGKRKLYNKYIEEVLGITIVVKNSTGHQSIYLKKGDTEYNIADVGFGYSQILPIVTKLWDVQKGGRVVLWRDNREKIFTSLIEQPELHLHPALQAKLADAMMKVALIQGKSQRKTNFIIETHSPTFINRIGRRVREGRIAANDVNVLLFDKDKESGDSKIKVTQFNEKGQIEHWPFGFFDPEDDAF